MLWRARSTSSHKCFEQVLTTKLTTRAVCVLDVDEAMEM
jgi:hypothetical protein